MEKAGENKRSQKRNSRLFFKVCFLMFALVALQLLVFVIVLIFSGEFSAIKKFSYSVLVEKTQNRASYIESFLNQKTPFVHETADEINQIVAALLIREEKNISEINTDPELNKKIISETAQSIISLSRIDMTNDVFLYLDTGTLYETERGNRLTGFYIRDTDITSNDMEKNGNLCLEMGSSEMAGQLGLTLDYEWSQYTDLSCGDDFSFFNVPIEAYQKNKTFSADELGFWSGLSRISPSAEQSIKYTVPLILDGKVYGVLGIGLLKKNILNNIPASDFLNESACYVLAVDRNGDGIYRSLVHSGATYERLVAGECSFDKMDGAGYGLYHFKTKENSIGSIQDILLYSSVSPFQGQKWALISVADPERILEIYYTLVKMFVISSCISVFFSALFAVVLSRRIVRPITAIIHTLEREDGRGQIVQFTTTGIQEFDKLTGAIVDLQVKMREQAFRVSDILSIADSGIGGFMYDYHRGDVFVGRSLIKMLGFSGLSIREDAILSFECFKEYLKYFDEKYDFFALEVFSELPNEREILGINLEVSQNMVKENGAKQVRWFRFTLTRDKNAVIGLVQDITETVLERQKIEHERDYDITTGLYNRRAFYQRIQELFAQPEKLKIAAFLMIDLDNLKFVNDTYGHDFGDDYIRTAASALRMFGEEDGISARLSGDEFITFLYGGETKEQIQKRICEFEKCLRASYCILADGTHYKVRASGGISWYPQNSRSYEELVKYADFAMYTIKHSTKGNFAEFDENTYRNDSILVTGIEEMNRIIDNGDIQYAFQPILVAETGEVYGYEALMRPNSKMITSIREFIRIAKSAAKLYQLERLTWFLGLANFSALIEEGKIPKNIHIFLNSISNCILDEETLGQIEKMYRPLLKNIVMEISEGEQNNTEYAKRKREIIEGWGATIALDDFGAGYNSEYALITMNPGMIKIDGALLRGCDTDPRKQMMIKNLVELAKAKDVVVLAEGIETVGEMRSAVACGVDLLQGYYFAKPMFVPEEVEEAVVKEIVKAKERGG